ncbi:hypothetical protein SRHO_G00168750 [Serrasalmus rhombeus]
MADSLSFSVITLHSAFPFRLSIGCACDLFGVAISLGLLAGEQRERTTFTSSGAVLKSFTVFGTVSIEALTSSLSESSFPLSSPPAMQWSH